MHPLIQKLVADEIRALREHRDSLIAQQDALNKQLEDARGRCLDQQGKVRAAVSDLEAVRHRAATAERELGTTRALLDKIRETLGVQDRRHALVVAVDNLRRERDHLRQFAQAPVPQEPPSAGPADTAGGLPEAGFGKPAEGDRA